MVTRWRRESGDYFGIVRSCAQQRLSEESWEVGRDNLARFIRECRAGGRGISMNC